MKKFLITCFILLVLAGLVFIFGWAQVSIPHDSYGVIRSRTHGIYPQTIKPGELDWIWYKLIPANVKTYSFRLDPVSREFSSRSMLPSKMVYSSFTGMENDFSWEITASISFSISPDSLASLVSENNIKDQEDLAVYEGELSEQIEYFLLRHFDSPDQSADYIESLLINGGSHALEKEIQEQFPQIQNFSLKIKSAKMPNFRLYRQAMDLYQLEQLGALLTRYPILLEYLAIEKK